nr:type VI secretion system tip protein TssI/VgrG [uncultured Cohaesibacter sp.]
MAGTFLQDSRIAKLTTPLGKDKLSLLRFDVSEGINENFEIRILAISEEKNIDFNPAIGKHCSLSVNTISGNKKYFDGLLAETQWLGIRDGGFVYSLTLRPWLWFLLHRTNLLIFHNKTAPDIISEIFGDHGQLADYERRLTNSYPTLEYTVQYRESDAAFVRRLMEKHGISFHYSHEEGRHSLILTDSPSAFEPLPGEHRPYYPTMGQYRREEEHLYEWFPGRSFTTSQFAYNDYNFKTPSAKLMSIQTGDAQYETYGLEKYDFPGKYIDQGEGKQFVQTAMTAERMADEFYSAAGNCIELSAGTTLTLEKHPDASLNQTYLAIHCNHRFVSEAYTSGGGGLGEAYSGDYEFIKSDKALVPEKLTAIPKVYGPQTAKVVGQGEIDCDEFGRILVRFYWDRKADQSMRCRVSQVWAGKSWGGMFIPRVDMEVVVEFLEGDPDRPIVTGCVYNGENAPPFSLPDNKNINGWKSDSTVGGGGYNEFVFDDTKGNELVRMHAQYDHETKVLNDERRDVGVNRATTVGNNDDLTVGNEITVIAGKKITLKVGASSIVMDTSSITITSPTVEVRAKQEFVSKAGMISRHKAGAEMDIKGAIVKINS